MQREHDVVVIGAGPAGEVAAGRLAKLYGRQVALVERELVGGECSFWACMPSKALLRPGELLAEARRVPGVSQAVTGELDVAAALARRDEVVHGFDDSGQLPWIQERGIALVRGPAQLEGERRVRVGEEVLVAREAVVLAVGSGALFPPIPGLAEVAAWSNREITAAREVPESLVVLGGGVVGVEMAQAWSTFGTRVTVVEAVDRLISREEPIASEQVAEALRRAGVDIRLGQRAQQVQQDGEEISVQLENGESVSAARLLVAIGRRPHTDGLGLQSVGLPEGYVKVRDTMRVPDQPWLYAIGDVNGRSLLTHDGKYQARIAADNIAGRHATARSDVAGPPRVIFTDPQVAGVGLTLGGAREQGLNVDVIDLDTSASAGASFYGRGTPGTSRFVIDLDREVLVGVTFVGFEVAEFLQAATHAVVGELPLHQLAHAVAPFPTRSELWLQLVEAAETLLGHSLHTG